MRGTLALCLGLLAAPCAAQDQRGDRWQLTLNSGEILWDLRLVKLAGDTLVVRNDDSTYTFPIAQLDELRLVRKAERSLTAETERFAGVLNGGDDVAYRLTLYDLAERRQVLRQVFQDHAPEAAP
ncbi:MAG TPA: hypothetical protein VFU41_07960 [Gemmatimonadales bacterium]|nr:hypothetical protein [Gemmatimonadales bacterium]